ncbi:MAG: transposase, partial [Acidimicrobiales bacterium]
FHIGAVTAACRKKKVKYSITVRLNPAIRKAIARIADDAWTPIPYWIGDGADVAETTYQPFGKKAPIVRLIVRRVRPTPGSQLALFVEWSYHALITDRVGDTIDLEADHRRHAIIEDTIRDLKYGVGLNHFPSGKFGANAAWLALNVIAHNLARRPPASGSTNRPSRRRRCAAATCAPQDGSPAQPANRPCTFPSDGHGRHDSSPPSPASARSCSSSDPTALTAPRTPAAPDHHHPEPLWLATPRHSAHQQNHPPNDVLIHPTTYQSRDDDRPKPIGEVGRWLDEHSLRLRSRPGHLVAFLSAPAWDQQPPQVISVSPAAPYRTVRAVLPHTALRHRSSSGIRSRVAHRSGEPVDPEIPEPVPGEPV